MVCIKFGASNACVCHIARMDRRILTIAFLRPSPDDHWANKLTGRVSRHPFCHVELFFESLNQSFSVVWGETAGFRFKNLSNPNYHVVSIGVSLREYDTCLEFCRTCTTHALEFDDTGMWRSWFPRVLTCTCCDGSSQCKGRTFCSKIVTEALQFAGVAEVASLIPSATTPSTLYQAVSTSSRIICSGVPYKRQAIQRCTPIVAIRMV